MKYNLGDLTVDLLSETGERLEAFMRRVGGLLVVLAILGMPMQAAPPLLTYRLAKVVPLGTPDRWDYLTFDPISDRVYVAHGDRVTVVNGKTGAIIGNIEGMPGGTHGIAIVHAAGKGFTDDGRAGEAAEFDLKTLKAETRIKAADDADGIIFDPPSGNVYVIDGDSAELTAIDPRTQRAIATIPAGGGLEFGVSGDNGKLYVNGNVRNEIVRIDVAAQQADAHWPMPGCIKPHGLAIDLTHHRLFSSCSNKAMAVMDADTGKELATLPIGLGSDFAVFDPKTQRAYSSNRDGTISVIKEISPDKFVVLPPIPTQYGARTMAVDPKTGRLYTVTADISSNKAVPATGAHNRFTIKPGTVRLLFLDPVH